MILLQFQCFHGRLANQFKLWNSGSFQNVADIIQDLIFPRENSSLESNNLQTMGWKFALKMFSWFPSLQQGRDSKIPWSFLWIRIVENWPVSSKFWQPKSNFCWLFHWEIHQTS